MFLNQPFFYYTGLMFWLLTAIGSIGLILVYLYETFWPKRWIAQVIAVIGVWTLDKKGKTMTLSLDQLYQVREALINGHLKDHAFKKYCIALVNKNIKIKENELGTSGSSDEE